MKMIKKIIKRLLGSSNERKTKLKEIKVFCIGRNKTGTTSLKIAFEELGYVVGNQRQAEFLTDSYFKNDFQDIINYCKTADAFQDIPFSWPETYKHLDNAYPKSKFILTIRDSDEQWYKSMINFQSKIYGKGNLPSWDDLKEATYVYKGWAYKNRQKIFGLSLDESPYDKKKLIDQYNKHNEDVVNYFINRPNDLLIINISEKEAYARFCKFINVESEQTEFPWENKTSKLEIK